MQTSCQISASRAAGFRQGAIVIFYLTGKLAASNLPGGDWSLEMEVKHLTQVGGRILKYLET